MMEFAVTEQQNSLNKVPFYISAVSEQTSRLLLTSVRKVWCVIFPIAGLPSAKFSHCCCVDRMIKAQWDTLKAFVLVLVNTVARVQMLEACAGSLCPEGCENRPFPRARLCRAFGTM